MHHRHIGRLGTLENLGDINTTLAPGVHLRGAVAHQSGGDDIGATFGHGGNFMA